MDIKHTRLARTLVFVTVLLAASMAGPALAGPVNVNTADAATLSTELKGVGDKTAAAIVAYREANGPFETIDDLKRVKGVGDAIIEKNMENIRFSD